MVLVLYEARTRVLRGIEAEKTARLMKKCRWLKPKVKVQADFVEWTESRKLRHPEFVRLS